MNTPIGVDAIDPAAVAAFRDQGCGILRGVVDPADLERRRPALRGYILSRLEALDRESASIGASASNPTFTLADAPAEVAEFVASERLGAIAARLLDAEAVRILHFCGFFKPAGGRPTPWHQDLSFIPLETDRVLTIWVPLIEVTPDMGGLLFAAGSHRAGPLDPAAASGFRRVENGTMRPGDLSVHMGWTLHASTRNATDRVREAVAVCFYEDGARVRGAAHDGFAGALRQLYFPNLRPGDVAAGPLNPVVYRRAAREPGDTP